MNFQLHISCDVSSLKFTLTNQHLSDRFCFIYKAAFRIVVVVSVVNSLSRTQISHGQGIEHFVLLMLTSWSLICRLPKGRRFRVEVTIEYGVFRGFSVLWGVFTVRDRFLTFPCLLVFSLRSSFFCVLWRVEAKISKFLFRRRALSWQPLQQNLEVRPSLRLQLHII